MNEDNTTAVDTSVDAGTEMQTEAGTNSIWYDRLCVEANELDARRASLRTFLDSNDYTLLPASDRDLLQDQYNFMHGYSKILTARIDRYNAAQQPAIAADPAGSEPDEPPATGDDTVTATDAGTDTTTAQADADIS